MDFESGEGVYDEVFTSTPTSTLATIESTSTSTSEARNATGKVVCRALVW